MHLKMGKLRQEYQKKEFLLDAAQKMKFSIKHFLSKCDQARSLLRSWSNLLKKSLMESFIFCTVRVVLKILFYFNSLMRRQ